MPVYWSISHTKQLVIAVAKGKVSSGEIMDYFVGVTERGGKSYGKLFHIQNIQNVLTDENVRMLGKSVQGYSETGKIGPVAIIVSNDYEYEKAQLFSSSSKLNRPLTIFKEWHKGRDWLKKVMDYTDANTNNN